MPGTLKKLAIASAASVAVIGASLTTPTTADARDGLVRFRIPVFGLDPSLRILRSIPLRLRRRLWRRRLA